MPTNFEIAVISLLVVNIIASVYYNYHSEEYRPPLKRPQETKQKPKMQETKPQTMKTMNKK